MTLLKTRILQILSAECMLEDETQVKEYVTRREKQILDYHIENVFPIKEPGEKGGDKTRWLTKLTPNDRNHDRKIRANTREEIEEKIVAFYLKIEINERFTVRDVLLMAVDETTKTGKRTVQRFDKRLSSIAKLKISRLDEAVIRKVLAEIIALKVSQKEFNQTITSLNKIADYCAYEHIDVCNIRKIVAEFRAVKLSGKHIFIETTKQTKNLAFNRNEASKIIADAVENKCYKSLAVAMLITTGLRVGELLGLELTDIFIDDAYLWIHQTEDAKTYEINDYVKENKSREVYLSSEALCIVKMAVDYRKNDRSDSPFLFLNKNSADGKLHIRAVDNWLRSHVHEDVLNLGNDREPRSPHDCRRTYASLEYMNGTDIYTIKNQLGHSSIIQTEEYIKDVVEANERKKRLKGIGYNLDAVGRN